MGHLQGNPAKIGFRATPCENRDSIHAVKEKGGKEYRIVADAQAQDGLYYGKIVEFSPKINKPFMYPAMDAKREIVKKKIVDAVREAVRKR